MRGVDSGSISYNRCQLETNKYSNRFGRQLADEQADKGSDSTVLSAADS